MQQASIIKAGKKEKKKVVFNSTIRMCVVYAAYVWYVHLSGLMRDEDGTKCSPGPKPTQPNQAEPY